MPDVTRTPGQPCQTLRGHVPIEHPLQLHNQLAPFGLGTGTSHNDQPRSASKAFGSGFGSGASAWNGDIWSGSAIGSGMKSRLQDNSQILGMSPMPSKLAFGSVSEPSDAGQQLLAPQPQPQQQPPPQTSSPPSRKRKAPGSAPIAAMPPMSSTMPSSSLGKPSDAGQQANEGHEASSSMPLPKKSRTNAPWTPAEEQRLKVVRDAGNSWDEIAKTFPNRTEGSVKKHWYKDMHYADFAEDDSAALLAAIKEYEASKWKVIGQKVGAIREYEANKWKIIGQKVGKPAKACEHYARENFRGMETKGLVEERPPPSRESHDTKPSVLSAASNFPGWQRLGDLGKVCIFPAVDSLSLIRDQVLGELSESRNIRASLTLEWDLLGYMKSQYPDNDNADLGSVITLSGTVLHAQATTCSAYAQQTWPSQGLKVIEAFQIAIDVREHDTQVSSTDLDIKIGLRQGFCIIDVESEDPETVAEIVQQAVWMGAALRVSGDQRVQYSTFDLKFNSMTSTFFVNFETSDLPKEEQSCWLPIFTNPVIARGFPTPERMKGEQGLEVPIEIMAALSGARHVTEFEGGLVLKGFSVMLVPIKRHKQSIQWHLLRCSDDDRMPYRQLRTECLNRAMLEEVDYGSLRATRAFLGWWKMSETHLGTRGEAHDNIDWSPAGEARRPARFSGANLGFQTMLTGQLNFNLGAKDGRLHFSQKGPFQRIVQCAEKTPVVLYDLEDRRAWFVPALDVILHIVQTRHHWAPYTTNEEKVKLTPVHPKSGRGAAAEAVAANEMRKLYEREVATGKDYFYKDAILDIWSQMERLMEKDDSIEACPGLALHGTMQSKIHGWEYMSLVNEKNYRRKEATITKSSGGWVDLINDNDTLVLFATGFGDVIRPVSGLERLCPQWRSLPKSKDYIAAGVPIMELLYSEAGSRLSRKHLSTTHLQWHRRSTLFEQCDHTGPGRCECDRTQQIYHDSLFKTFGRVRPPGKLEEDGCVIFGQLHHSLKPTKPVAIRENAVHMLPNTSIQDPTIAKDSLTRYDSIQSPFSPASFSTEREQISGYAVRSPKRPPSPLNFHEEIAPEETVTRKKRRKMSHIQTPSFDPCKGSSDCDDHLSLSDDCTPSLSEYQSMLRHDTLSNEQSFGCTETVYASKAERAPSHAQKTIRHKANIQNYSHRYGCTCTICSRVKLEPSDGMELVGTTNGARSNLTNTAERRQGQPVWI